MIITAEQKKQYEAFWAQEAVGRCCLYLTAPKNGAPAEEKPQSLFEQWEDIPGRTRRMLRETESTAYFADAFPSAFANFGPGCLAPCVGGSYKWSEFTVWFENEPFFITDWENPPELKLLPDSKMVQLVDRYTAALLEAGRGKFFTSITDIGGAYDIIAALRGTENLLIDLLEYPEEVKAFAEKLGVIWKAYFEQNAGRLLQAQGAMTSWMPIYSEKPYYPLQCDFSAMISPQMFGEFILPDLKYHTDYLPRSVYHWDGPGELLHLPHLLSLDRLTAIQWTPGDGAPDTTDPCWYPYYERIQRAGKSLILLSADPNGIENLLRHVSAKGLFLCCNAADEKQAAEILQLADAIGVR